MFNNAEEHLQGKFRLQQLNFPVVLEICSRHFSLLSSAGTVAIFIPVCRFFHIATWIFCKILIGDTAADLLAISARGAPPLRKM